MNPSPRASFLRALTRGPRPLLLFLGVLAASSGIALAQSGGGTEEYGVHEKHLDRLTEAQKVAPVGVDGFGDQISYFSGGLGFNNVDVAMQGNSPLPV